jgi:hypothetical protein
MDEAFPMLRGGGGDDAMAGIENFLGPAVMDLGRSQIRAEKELEESGPGSAGPQLAEARTPAFGLLMGFWRGTGP